MLLLLYCFFIYWLSDQPSLPVPEVFSSQDKILHFGAYFVMGILAWRYFKTINGKTIILVLLSITFCSLYGLSDEWHQSFIEGRFSDVADWIADTSGAGAAVLVLYKLGW